MYQIVVFIHVLAVILFMLTHGVSVFVLMLIDRQENPEQVRALLGLRNAVSPAVAILSLVILATGVIAAFMGNWWRMGWTGASLVLFIGIAVVMTLFGRRYFDRLAALFNPAQQSERGGTDLVAQAGRSPRILLTVVGIVGVGVILWLMMVKPF